MKDNYKDIFKKEFDVHEDDIDPQIIWDSLRPKKKRRSFLIYLFPVILGLASIYVLYNTQEIEEADPLMDTSVVDKTSDRSMNNSLGSAEVEMSNSKMESDLMAESPSKNKTEVIELKEERNFTEVRERQNENNNQNQSQNHSQNNNQNLNVKEGEKRWGVSRNERQNQNVNQNENEVLLVDRNVVVENQNIISSDPKSNQIKLKKLLALPVGLLQLAIRDMPKMKLRLGEIMNDKRKLDQKSELNTQWSLALNGAYGVMDVDARMTESGSNESYLEARNNTVEQLEAVRTNLLLNYHFGEKLSLTSGLQYTRLNELFTWRGSYTQETNGQYPTEITTTPDETIVTYAEGNYEEKIVRNMKIYNKTNVVAIPLRLNLHQSVGDFTINLSGGVEANVLQWKDGFVLNEMDAPVALHDQEKSKFSLSYTAGTGLEYRLNDQLGLSANVAYVMLPQSENLIESEYRILKFGVGLRYALGK